MPELPLLEPASLVPALNPVLVTDGVGLNKVADFLKRKSVFTKDYETNVVPNFFERRARTLQLGDRDEQYIIDLLAFAETKENLIASQGFYGHAAKAHLMKPVLDVVEPAINSNKWLKYGHNLEFEYTTSKWCFGMRFWNMWCSQTVERIIYNGEIDFYDPNFWGLGDLIARYCRVQISKAEQKTFDLETPLTENQIVYCALDCRLLFPIVAGQKKKLAQFGLERVAQIENDAIPAFGDMHLNGIYLNPQSWTELGNAKRAEKKLAVAELDKFFLPIVGQKKWYDEELIERLHNEWREHDVKTPEEEALGAEIRSCRSNPERKAELVVRRRELEELRKQKKAEARIAYSEKSKEKTYIKNEWDKWDGEARINYGAWQQLIAALYKGNFGLNKKNFPNTNDRTLEKHAGKPVIKALRKYRALDKQLGTYGERWTTTSDKTYDSSGKKGFVSPYTGRIHASFLQLGTETGRASCTAPNLLNLPAEDAYRACFQAAPLFVFPDLPIIPAVFTENQPKYVNITMDCNGQELCIAADYSGEPVWVEAFRKGWDVHSLCAEMLKPKQWKEATVHEPYEYEDPEYPGQIIKVPKCAYYYPSEKCPQAHAKCKCPGHVALRKKLKAVDLGVIYGKGAWALAADLDIDVDGPDGSEQLLRDYWEAFPVLHEYLEKSGEEAFMKLESRTRSGRRRLFQKVGWEQARRSAIRKLQEQHPEEKNQINDAPEELVRKQYKAICAGIKREGMNTPFQGTGADIVKRAMGCGFDKDGQPYMWHRLEPEFASRLTNFIYDELLVETPEDRANEVALMMSDCIRRAGAEFIKSVPMTTDHNVSHRWMK